MSDTISRRQAIEALRRNQEAYLHDNYFDKIVETDIETLTELPSAQPKKRTEERTETHACDLIDRQAAIDAHYEYCNKHPDASFPVWSLKILEDLPSAQPEPCEDAVSREEAKWVVFCNRDHVEDQANAIDALPPVTLKAEHPDLSEYSDKLWKAAYERGKAEAQQRWIPCSERLPEPRVAVLGYAPKFKNIFALYYDSVMGWMVWSPIRDDCLPNSQGDIIAWMPLPEPYKEGGAV